jgi:hypothetical protein
MILIGLTLLLAAAAALTGTGAARADTVTLTWAWKTAGGGHLYVTTDGTTPYGFAESGNAPGRTFTSTSSGTYSDPNDMCTAPPSTSCTEYNLKLNSGYCIAATSGLNVDIKPCNADGTVWALLFTGGSDFMWINVEMSNKYGSDVVLTGDNVLGDPLTVNCGFCMDPNLQQQWQLQSR